MYGYQGAESRGSGVKVVVVFVGLLIAAAFVAGWMLADSYWGNPPREEAEAEQIRIENRGTEERQRIELEAYQRQKDIEVQAVKERAERALWWQDRWNELAMVLATVAVAGLLIIAGVRIAAPVTVHAYERHAYHRARLVEQQTRFEEMQAARMREKRQLLEEVRLQRVAATLAQERDGGNGGGRGSHPEQSAILPTMQASPRHSVHTE